MGVDLGTASTRIVIRTPFRGGGRAMAVSFGDLAHRSSPFLLPTKLYESASGALSLSAKRGATCHSDVKVAVMGESADPVAVARAAAYLALAIRIARDAFTASDRSLTTHHDLRWQVNIGVPSAGYDDRAVRDRFRSVASAGWLFSEHEPAYVSSRLDALLGSNLDPGIQVEAIPEVAAQAVGYARSPYRDPGLHVLVDVGATTLDVCGFMLNETGGEDNYSLLTASVSPLGVVELHRTRAAQLGFESELDDPIAEIPDRPSPGDGEFRDRCVAKIMQCLMYLKRHRDPNSSRWHESLPVFLCGGGSYVPLYREALEEADKRLRSSTNAKGLLVRSLPVPASISSMGIKEDFFHRLSVAYGLSFDRFNFGEIQSPKEIENVPPPSHRAPKPFVGKEHV